VARDRACGPRETILKKLVVSAIILTALDRQHADFVSVALYLIVYDKNSWDVDVHVGQRI
jgi:hypothetical protein